MFRISMKNIGELINRPAWLITNEKCVDKACRIRNKNNYTIYGGRIVRISIEDAGNMSQPCLRAFAAVVIDEKEFSMVVDDLSLNVQCFDTKEEAERMLAQMATMTCNDVYLQMRKEMKFLFEGPSFESTISLPKSEIERLNTMLSMTGKELYSKYGLKRNETVTYTAAFGDGIEMDVKLVICDEDTTPYLDVVLFQNGNEVFCDAPGYYVLPEKFSANWDGRTFVANIKAVTA